MSPADLPGPVAGGPAEPVQDGPVQDGPAQGPLVASVRLPDAAATRAWGAALADVLRAGDLVILTGELGAGKTTLAQGIGAGLGVRGPVASPTFIIARVHPSLVGGPAMVHVDAYRLGGLDELEALDLETSLEDSVTLVEWGEGLAEGLAEDRLEIHLDRGRGETGSDTVRDGAGASGGIGGAAGEDEGGTADEGGGERLATVRAIGPRWDGVTFPA
jgi:tRNA threonylcarbamoyladenosine biosynthesis protein TsaE